LKEEYLQYCKDHKIPVFAQPWWLSTVSEDKWDVVSASYKGVVAYLPFCYHHKFVLKKIYQPLLTPYLGPIYELPEGLSLYNTIQYENELYDALCKQLPKFLEYKQKLFPSISNHLPFYWNGYSQTTQYTYILETIDSEEVLFGNIKDSLRRQIRKSNKLCAVTSDNSDANTTWQLAKQSLLRQRAPLIPEDTFVLELMANAHAHAVSKTFTAYYNDIAIASLFLVEDAYYVYYLFGGYDDNYASTGAKTLLFWNAILYAKEKGLLFNFEGSMLKGVEQYFRSFGAQLQPVHFIWK